MKHAILLAEDEEAIAKLVDYKLKKEGYEIYVAKNGQEALDQLGAREWSLIILDVMMPVRDGWQVLKELKASQYSTIPVLMLTAKSRPKDISNAAELGATQLLGKPFDPTELAACVHKMIEG